jgi:hypothetical protein
MSEEEFGRRAARASFASRAMLVLAIALLGAVLWILLSVSADTNEIVTSVEKQQNSNTGMIDAAQQTLDRVVDCTEPGGKCFNEGTERTASAVGDIGRLSVYASACAADPHLAGRTLEDRADAIERCVTRLLKRTAPPKAK